MIHAAWTKRDGAPIADFGMAQDERGMLWFASTNGLYRFDGVHFDRLTAIDGNNLRSSNTNAVLAVGTALWVGYNFGGVSVFDQGKVRHYGVKEGLPENTVHRLARGANGVIWLSTSRGLYRFDGQRWRIVGPEDGLPPGDSHNFIALQDGSILAEHKTGLYRSTADGSRFSRVPLSTDLQVVGRMSSDYLFLRDQHNRHFRYAPLTNTLTPLDFPAGEQPFDGFVDGRGAVWINTDTGLKLLDEQQRVLKTFIAPLSLSGKMILNTLNDREGNLWVTTENGVDRFRESRLTVMPLPPRVDLRMSVQAGSDGIIWIGHDNYFKKYDAPSFGLRPDGSQIAGQGYGVTGSTRAPDGSVWLGSDESLLRVKDEQWLSWPLPPELRGNPVQAMAMDRDGALWISIVHKAVFRFHDGQWEPYGGLKSLPAGPAVSLNIDARQRLWFGYPSNRLAVLDAGAVRQFTAKDGLDVGNVTAVVSHDDQLWVGGDQGVAALENGRFVDIVDAEGRPLGGVTTMIRTTGGELWLHGVDGLIRIGAAEIAAGLKDGHRMHIERFDYLDGHEGKPEQMRPLATLTEAADGRLWYATSSSVGWIDPRHIVRNKLAPTAQVTALRTDKQSYPTLPGIVLPQRTTNLEIDYTAAALSIPERVRFRYRLQGMEQQWREAGTRRTAFYTNLDPGNYRFEVMAANEDGVWSVAPAALAFRIEPAFIQTNWFKLLCVLVALLLAALLYWWRIAHVTGLIADRLRERQRERERIARALHDSFLQSVQALMMQFHLIKHRVPADDPVQKTIDDALDTADDVLSEGRDQVLALRLNHELSGDLETALAGLGNILAPRYQSRFKLEIDGAARPLRAMAAAESYAIAREAMLNAFRHAQSDEVTVVLRHARTQFSLEVRDRGCGMSTDVYMRGHRPGHWGLTGMRERAHDAGGSLEIVSEAGRGTTITLRLPARRAYARQRR